MAHDPSIVGVGELAVRSGAGESLRMVGVGSCVALVAVDVNACVGAIAHVVLSGSDPKDPIERPPAYYADLAVPALLVALRGAGSPALPGYLRIRLIGGGSPSGTSLDIGARNVACLKRVLFRHGFRVAAEDVGGTASRSVTVLLPFEQVKVTMSHGGVWVL